MTATYVTKTGKVLTDADIEALSNEAEQGYDLKPRVPLGNALIVVDIQRDFCPGGSLAVEGGDEVAQRIHDFIQKYDDAYKVIVATKDYHPDERWEKTYGPFTHFSDTPNYVNTWPRHCVQGTEGAEFHDNLDATAPNSARWPPLPGQIEFDLVFYKGQTAAAYSGFEGSSMPSGNFEPPMGWALNAYLADKNVGHVDIVGLATDYCVKATAIDAIKNGYDVTVLLDMCAGVNPDSTEEAVREMVAAGIHVERNI